MSIISYLAYPVKGKREQLIQELQSIENCEVVPAKNHDLIIVVSETDSKEEEETFKNTVNDLNSLDLLSMVSGFDANGNELKGE